MSRVAVIVVTHNGCDDTRTCLRSLYTHEPFIDVIVVDNASTDGTVRALREQFPALTILHNNENKGFAAANNRGIRYAREQGATHVLLLNNDTVITSPFLEPLLQCLEDDSTIGAVAPLIYAWPDITRVWGAGGRFRSRIARPEHLTVAPSRKPYPVDFLSGCAVLVSVSAITAVGPLDEDFFLYHEDVEWSLRMRDAGYQLMVVPTVSLFHKGSRSTKGPFSPLATHHSLLSNLRLIQKRYRPWQRVVPYLYVGLLSFKTILNTLLYRLPHKRAIVASVGTAWKEYFRI